MTSVSNKGWRIAAVGSVAAVALVLAGCASGGGNSNNSGSGKSIVIGTTDKVTFLDPAGSFDNGSLTVQTQVFATLMNSKPGTSDVQPDLASKAEFSDPNTYTVTLKNNGPGASKVTLEVKVAE